jgi:hypothetical protein
LLVSGPTDTTLTGFCIPVRRFAGTVGMIHAHASVPLVWDKAEQAYYFFLSCDGKTKNNIWLSEPTSDLAKISYKRKEKKQRDNMKKRKEEEECADNQ